MVSDIEIYMFSPLLSWARGAEQAEGDYWKTLCDKKWDLAKFLK